MPSRRLSADEAALWARVMAGVRPLTARADALADHTPVPSAPGKAAPRIAEARLRSPPAAAGARPAPSRNTLDGTWDRQLARGLVAPDRTVDLHGHTLASAHGLLDRALTQATRDGDRLILLVTGKPPRPASERPHPPAPFRGAIRAAIGDWLAGSAHSHAIAAVRPAHPRHGGAGALYIVLRRARAPRKS